MAQLSDDCFAFGGALMSVDEAIALIRARVTAVTQTCDIALGEAGNHVLAAPLVALLDLPPFANSAVDGYAVAHAALAAGAATILPVTGRAAAGRAVEGRPDLAGALRIFTGAAMPEGFDTVFMQEDCEVRSDGDVVLPPGLTRGANMRPAGEDVARGEMALGAGRRLLPQDLALAAALGTSRLTVRRALRVALFSTGDELAAPGAALAPGQVHDSNRIAQRRIAIHLILVFLSAIERLTNGAGAHDC